MPAGIFQVAFWPKAIGRSGNKPLDWQVLLLLLAIKFLFIKLFGMKFQYQAGMAACRAKRQGIWAGKLRNRVPGGAGRLAVR
ncbi:hypothetical protein H9Q10_04645 [Eikenella sp. S3360]|uniref:Uncharacterized protein n=1 Tax=Eikenella glucosivorans TaxID=2766967 RepID=A0ABS0N9K7_9NEIS|nr:hypothetical protein [Eikenella glucosivorans]MBH5328955.1 hypothetical protein [Eikenella glucosivorans]